jgi:hypothetical protein
VALLKQTDSLFIQCRLRHRCRHTGADLASSVLEQLLCFRSCHAKSKPVEHVVACGWPYPSSMHGCSSSNR